MLRNNTIVALILIFSFILIGCSSDTKSYPRPRGYFRIDFPEKNYEKHQSDCPFEFEVPSYSHVENKAVQGGNCFKNIHFGWYKATLHCTYAKADTNLAEYTKIAKQLAYEHKILATAIDEIPIIIDSNKVYGIIYDIKGNVASNYSFYITDSSSNYFAGSLYFNMAPNVDSIQPVLDYLKEDIRHLIHSFEWKTVD